MDFGRLKNTSDIDKIVLRLPVDHPETERVLQAGSPKRKTEVYIGLPITSHPQWIGTIYPPKPKNDLLHYGKQFNSLEANSTGYGAPSEATITKWIKDTPESFRFCPKLPQTISRSKNLMERMDETKAFCESMRKLGSRLGTTFLQFPESFNINRLHELADFIVHYPKDIPLAVELRNKNWFNDEAAFDAIFSVMQDYNVSAIITDVLATREVLHQRLTNKTAFIRFNALDLHPTDYKRMDDWVLRIKEWMELGLEKLYFFVHTDHKELNPELSNYMVRELNKHCGLDLKECEINKGLF